MSEFFESYIYPIIATIITGVIGYVGLYLKNKIDKYLNDKTKHECAQTVVTAIEQIYKSMTGLEKYQIAEQSLRDMLNERSIAATDLEIKYLIESKCNLSCKEHKSETTTDEVVIAKGDDADD